MPITKTSLDAIRIGFDSSFQKGLTEAPKEWEKIAEMVVSTTASNLYGWLGQMPQMREWIGQRQLNQLGEHDYRIFNKKFENSVRVSRSDIEDDNLGIYTTPMKALGRAAANLPNDLVFDALVGGWDNVCYDGQNFFDTDHVVLNKAGKEVSVANTDGGNKNPWFLLDNAQPLKPLIYQQRKAPELTALDRNEDSNTFLNDEYLYGVNSRGNAGYGFWQTAWGSKQDLTPENYEKAGAAMMSFQADYERPLAINPRLLVVGPSNRAKALEILKAERNAAGATNIWQGTAELLVTPYLK